MTFEAFDAAPLIENRSFTPELLVAAETTPPDAATLNAARAERAEARAEATMLDLWIDRAGGANLRALEAGTSRHGWVQPEPSDIILDFSGVGAKDVPFFAAFGDDKSEEEDGAVVKGTRPKTVDDDSDWAEFWGGGGGDGSGDNGGGEAGGGGGTLDDQAQNDCRDRKAMEAQTAIKNEPDDDYREHGVIIYRGADGQVHKSDVLQGNERSIPRAVIVEWMTRNGVDFNQVIGFAHNHDAWFYGSTDVAAAVNRYPSDADWVGADWFVNNGAGGPGGENFAMYVIDTSHDMREFEYEDRSFYQSLDQDDKIAGSGLPNETTSDGSTCA